MPLDPGTRLGPYEILSPLGAGGMGEVYRARDTRLGREVAVKVLPQHLSSNPDVRARFEREARAISSLNHPHICTLHDVGREGDTDYLVMEMVEGETLAQRLSRGALALADVLRLGAQVAGALDRAHRAGVVHRDLKPGNIMLTRSGAKLMDFGLAKGVGPASSPSSFTLAPTATTPLTAQGTIVGTFQYMAPEQLEGREADARSDLFALGVVIYEMATGRRAFEGKTQASLAASILKEEPRPIRATDAMSPPALDRLVRLCLRKDPDDRIQSAHDVRLQLEAIAETAASPDEVSAGSGLPGAGAGPGAIPGAGSGALFGAGSGTVPGAGSGVFTGAASGAFPSAAAGRTRSRERLAWAIAALATITALALAAAFLLRPAPPVPPVLVSSLTAPEDTSFVPNFLVMALSPDGRSIAYVARGPKGAGLWVRPLDSSKPTLLATGADDAECPFWSPDSRWIGFRSEGLLKKIDVSGGRDVVLAPMRDCLGASWGQDGSILYVQDRVSPIMRIPAAGGEPTLVTAPRTADSRRLYSQPSLLPDGRHIIYTVNETWQGGTNSGIFLSELGGENEKLLLPVLSNARYVQPGYLVYGKDGSLLAQKFDLTRLELTGEPIPLVEGVQYIGSYQSHVFSVSDTGLLAYAEGRGTLTRQFTWVDRKGAIVGTAGKPGNYFSPRLSRDGRRIAYDQSEATTDSGDIWVLDVERGISNRLTFDSRNESSPIWSPDDTHLLFFGDYPGRSDLFTVPSDGTGKVEMFFTNGAGNMPADWSEDGKFIVVQASAGAGKGLMDIHIYNAQEKKAEPWLSSSFAEKQSRLSPDGRWISYDSDESGRMEVYVRGFPPRGGKWRISTDGGSSSVWSRDGKELFYVSADSTLMSVPVTPGPTFEGGAPVPLFKLPRTLLSLSVVSQYDVSPDGQRFLMNFNTSTQGQKQITLVANWTSLLPKR
jgi:eukaryotic-like serine/threonine-protein kinase